MGDDLQTETRFVENQSYMAEAEFVQVKVSENEFAWKDAAGNIVDGLTKKLSEKISDMTDGTVQIESILSGQIKIDANKYIDKVLGKLTQKIDESEITQVQLPEHKMTFEKSFLCGLAIPGDVDFRNGLISGLSSLVRFDDAVLKINAFSEPIMTARAVIGVKSALINYIASVSMLCLTEDDTQVTGGLKDAYVTVAISMSRDYKVNLDEFDVKSTGTLVFDFEKLGEIDLMSNDENASGLEKAVKEKVRDYLQNTIKNTAKDIIQALPLDLNKDD